MVPKYETFVLSICKHLSCGSLVYCPIFLKNCTFIKFINVSNMGHNELKMGSQNF